VARPESDAGRRISKGKDQCKTKFCKEVGFYDILVKLSMALSAHSLSYFRGK
jgi:hypothetical protein